jgi:hypothetical protein
MIGMVEVWLLPPKHHLVSQNMISISGNDINQQTTSCTYQEDTSKNDQRWAFLAGAR